jgi:tetratricopeptide (TPR) repeat protein
MVPWSELTPNYWRLWANTAAALCRRDPARNTWDLGTRFNTIIEHFARVGSHRLLIEVAALSLELALQRGARWVAQRQLGLARAHLPQLRQDRGASALVAALAARVESLPEVAPLPVPATELLAWLEARGEQNHSRDPEQEAQWLLQAHAQCPDDEPLADTAASALNACGAQAEARALLWDFVAAHPQHDGAAAYTLMRWLAEQGDDAGLRRLADVFRDSVPVFAHWCEVQRARRVSDWPALEQAATALLELSPGSHGARGTLARMYMETGRFSDAQACYAQLIELLEEPNAAHWDHMSAASAAHDWDAVRRSAAAIGMELSSTEGVVEEPWGWVIIRSEEEGEPMEYYARRSGPVTARIVENAPANRAQQVGDWVVFDAALVHPAPEDEEAREHFIPTYAQVHVLERGGFARSWLIDGAHPGEDAWNALVEAVEAQGWKIWAHSRPDYTVTDPEAEDGTLPGLLFTIAQPQDHAPLALHRFLQQATAGWAHPLCWLRLAEACDQDRQPHLDVIERYGL